MSWAEHLPILPVLLPALTAAALLLLGDAPSRRVAARAVAIGSVLLGAVLAGLLLHGAAGGALSVYRVGDWPAPFGIVLVIDRLAALMLMLTSAVALPVLIYAAGGWDQRGRYFHALFQFQLMGLNGAFVTGDLFNLFVFFEVLLIASYVLLLHGQGAARSRAGVHYVVLNLVASALFLIGVSLLYAVTGTLNYADLALRVPRLMAQGGVEATLAQVAALVLLVVFGFKAACVPLALWLPATYAAASAPVAALFAIMTKVGVYALLRVHGVIFGAGGAPLVEPILLPLALATAAMGVVGALAAPSLTRLVAWLTVGSVGTILVALGLFGSSAWAAGLYYLLNSTLIVAALFLLAETIASQRGPLGATLAPAAPVLQPALLGTLLLVAAVSMAGLPPLPGFIGKTMLLQAAAGHGWAVAVWAVVLGAGFLALLGLARAGSVVFWAASNPSMQGGARAPAAAPAPVALPIRVPASLTQLLPIGALLAASAAASLWAEPLLRYTQATAVQLADRDAYARAVLPEVGGDKAQSTRAYRIPQP